MGPSAQALSGGRIHFQHGPIDILAFAQGDPEAVRRAHESAWIRFETVLPELVSELAVLRSPLDAVCTLRGETARLMWAACRRCADGFMTPMAAVAGSVAEVLVASYARPGIDRAWVNNGGDIALYLRQGQSARVGLFADIAQLDGAMLVDGIRLDGVLEIGASQGVRGIATSGWRGRSFSLGIADSVTVLATSASVADAAATVIANAVDIDDPSIVRKPACAVKDDSDLGEIPVTVHVPQLSGDRVAVALRRGLAVAHRLKQSGIIQDCFLTCQGWWVSTQCSNVNRIAQADSVAHHTSRGSQHVCEDSQTDRTG